MKLSQSEVLQHLAEEISFTERKAIKKQPKRFKLREESPKKKRSQRPKAWDQIFFDLKDLKEDLEENQ